LLSVPKGQWEAAHSISMSWSQSLRHIILPQAARVAVPPLSNTFISLVKDTSLASVITVPEMFLAAQRIAAVTYQPLILYTEAAPLSVDQFRLIVFTVAAGNPIRKKYRGGK
jgi:cystine transport system permease protein